MKVQELIDKIRAIQEQARVGPFDDKEDLKEALKKIHFICDNILID